MEAEVQNCHCGICKLTVPRFIPPKSFPIFPPYLNLPSSLSLSFFYRRKKETQNKMELFSAEPDGYLWLYCYQWNNQDNYDAPLMNLLVITGTLIISTNRATPAE